MPICVKGYIETSLIDWQDRLAAVLFLDRCDFACPFCHISFMFDDDAQYPCIPHDELFQQLQKNREWVDSIVVTGGEPTCKPDLPEFLRELRGLGFEIKLDTNGSNPDMLERLISKGLVDYVAMDIKTELTAEAYSRAAGRPVDIPLIERSIDLLMNGDLPYEFRTTLVPGLITPEILRRIMQRLQGAQRFFLQEFVPENSADPEFRKLKKFNPKQTGELLMIAYQAIPGTIYRGSMMSLEEEKD